MSALELLAGLVSDTGQRLGDLLTSDELADARAALDPKGVPFDYWTAPRGDGKTTRAAAVALVDAVELAPSASRSYFVAVDRDQAGIVLDSLRGFVQRTPGLAGALSVEAWRVIVRSTRASIEVLASDGASAYGLRPRRVVVDELAAWPRGQNYTELWFALVSAMHKVPGSRLLVATTAGSPVSHAFKVLTHARASSQWRVSERAGPSSRITAEQLAEQGALLTAARFSQLMLNVWSSADEALVSAEDLEACVGHDDPLEPVEGVRYVIGVDLGLKDDATAIAVAHLATGGSGPRRVVVDRVCRLTGTRRAPVKLDEVEDLIADIAKRYKRASVVADPWQATGMCQRLRDRGLRVVEQPFTMKSNEVRATTLYRLLRDREIELPRDETLLDELGRVQLLETSTGTVRIDHTSGEHDDQVQAIGLAVVKLLEKPETPSIFPAPISLDAPNPFAF